MIYFLSDLFLATLATIINATDMHAG